MRDPGAADDDEVHVAIVVETSLDAVDAAELPARPALTLTSSKVPSPLLRKNAIGVVASLAVTMMSRKPSLSKSSHDRSAGMVQPILEADQIGNILKAPIPCLV